MEIDYVIVQAGGKGTRMERLTANKPKALVPIGNLPMIFHLFAKFPKKKFIVIGDYKADVLEKYLASFAKVDYAFVHAEGSGGTCGGLSEALGYIPRNTPFLLIWCDLVLPEEYELPEEAADYVGISKDFLCRWSYKDGKFIEERSFDYGVAGYFIFQDKGIVEDVPPQGEFVRWLGQKGLTFKEEPLRKTHEYGLIEEWNKIKARKSRPFNRIEIQGNTLSKIPLDEQGRKLAALEVGWYKKIAGYSFRNVPAIYGFEPLTMELVDGQNIYELGHLPAEEKKKVLEQIVSCLRSIHALGSVPPDEKSYYVAYIEKTFERLEKVKELVPFAKDEFVVVNGKKCHNVFFVREELEKAIKAYFPKAFVPIHGDCTFSNTLIDKDNRPVLIDPRGYFGTTEFYGDPAYDWAKLYYSIATNYDQFNLKNFELQINPSDVSLKIGSNHWEDMTDSFFALLKEETTKRQMDLFVAIIWLSLTTYAWEDYDSICGAFYEGLLLLERALYE